MFPLNPLFPPLLKNGSSGVSAAAPAHTTPQFSVVSGSPVDFTKCLSSLDSVQCCVTEIHNSVFTGKFGNVGAMCCKAFLAMDAKCWPHVFPLNPLFPPLLKDGCSRIAVAPTYEWSRNVLWWQRKPQFSRSGIYYNICINDIHKFGSMCNISCCHN